jgi:uncharacterized protein (DUF1697 family)
MSTYLVLFRGLNIGGHNKLPMKELASLLQELGYNNIKTYIQSGNVIFDMASRNREKLCSDIADAIQQQYGFLPGVMMLSAPELENMIAHNPFPMDNGKALHFLFMFERPKNPDLERLNALKTNREQFLIANKVFYLYAPDGVGRSRLAMSAERCLGVKTTGRNWNTISRLSEMLSKREQCQ